jgi:cytidylate kinase
VIFTVAIDGPAAAGKGTIARAVAAEFGFAHLDSGLLYRAVGARVLAGADPVTAARKLDPEALAEADLRSQAVAEAASRVAAIPEVRAALVAFQRDFARREGGAVLDGRDIGTVICPEAEVKLYVTASAEARAGRRFRELCDRGEAAEPARVLDEVRARDARDAGRAVAPLRPAADAVVIDTSEMTIAEAVARATSEVAARLTGR